MLIGSETVDGVFTPGELLKIALAAEVRVSHEEVDDRTLVIVADHGKGLEASKRGAAFDAFQRLGDRDNTVGVGLGLSVVKGFVEAMEGTVNATDTAGGGLTMIVDLPSAGSAPTGAIR
ncbi:Sensor protein KdpD [Mycobacteroides abscessus]|nr:Sensor protein KdpD [Mycobacteroides abscessus]